MKTTDTTSLVYHFSAQTSSVWRKPTPPGLISTFDRPSTPAPESHTRLIKCHSALPPPRLILSQKRKATNLAGRLLSPPTIWYPWRRGTAMMTHPDLEDGAPSLSEARKTDSSQSSRLTESVRETYNQPRSVAHSAENTCTTSKTARPNHNRGRFSSKILQQPSTNFNRKATQFF